MKPAVKQSGFSLMEVLIALAVLAIAMAALVKSAGGFTSNQAYLENKTIAHWVALNQLAKLRVSDEKQSVGTQQGQEEMAGRMWNWKVTLAQTFDQHVLKAEVTVQREEGEVVYSVLTGYVEVKQ